MQCRCYHPLLRVALALIAQMALLLGWLVVSQPLAGAQNPPPPHPTIHTPTDTTRLTRAYACLPLAFEPNLGQTDPHVKFLARTPRGTLFLTNTEAVLTLPVRPGKAAIIRSSAPSARTRQVRPMPTKIAVLRMKLAGANRAGRAAGLERLAGIINTFRGNDPKRWHTNIPTYRRARFAGVYRGIDMVYYGTQNGRLEYDFRVKPGADPAQIKLAFSGAEHARVTAEGDLALTTAAGEVYWQRPVTYQMVNGRREPVVCSYRLERRDGETSARFVLARYDSHRPLVIDPVLQYSTYLGGTGGDDPSDIAVDSAGNAYVTGATSSDDFPATPGALQTTNNTTNYTGFVTKLNASGTALLYSTYLGGNRDDGAQGIAVDSAGNAYVSGFTYSHDFPVTQGALQTTNHTNYSYQGTGFVTKLNASGTALLYSTYLGGNRDDQANGIAVDSAGNAYVTGITSSSDFQVTPGAFQPTTTTDHYTGFVTKLNASGTALIYSTYLGGSDQDYPSGIAVDSSGNTYIAGFTYSHDFPVTPGAFQTTNNTSDTTGFVTKLNASGTALLYSTYLGGSEEDGATGIAIDSVGNTYVSGYTDSHDFPVTPGAFQTTNNTSGGDLTCFVTKLNASGTALLYSTYLGGNYYDISNGIAVDSAGNAYVIGLTYSDDFPITPDAFQTTNNTSDTTGFVTKLNAFGTALLYSTYLGGSIEDGAQGIALDSAGNAYVTGYTASDDFPVTPGAFQTTNYSPINGTAFVAKFAFGLTLISLSPDNVSVGSGSFIGTINGYGFVPGAKALANGSPLTTTFVSSTQLTVAVTAAELATAARVTVSVMNPNGSLSNSLLFNIGQPQLQVTGVTNLIRNPDNSISLTVQITNSGTGSANAQLTGAILNGVGTTTSPLPGGLIPVAKTASLTLTFPATAGTSGQAALLSVTGTANGSNVNGFQPVTLP